MKKKKIRHRWVYPVPYRQTSVSKSAVCSGCGAKLWVERGGRAGSYRDMVQVPGCEPLPYSQVPGCRPKRRAA